MKNIIYDSRWLGEHGIGRFASEIRKRISWPLRDIKGSDPVSKSALASLDLQIYRQSAGRRNVEFFSPGYTPPTIWRGKFVFTIHDLIHIDFPEENSRFKSIYYNQIVKPGMRRAKAVLTVSEYSKQRLIEWSGLDEQKIVVVGNGVDPIFSPFGEKKRMDAPYMLYIRNSKPHKNVLALVRAFAIMQQNDVKLVLNGSPEPEIQHEALRLGVLDRIIFAGRIPENQLPAYYRGAAVVIMPSLYEGFGLPALEGMASGVPVVVSNTTSLPEVVSDAGILVDPTEPLSIAEGLDCALSDTLLRHQLKERGLMRAKLFNWDDVAARVNRVMECE